jgi:hypothetical protein
MACDGREGGHVAGYNGVFKQESCTWCDDELVVLGKYLKHCRAVRTTRVER